MMRSTNADVRQRQKSAVGSNDATMSTAEDGAARRCVSPFACNDEARKTRDAPPRHHGARERCQQRLRKRKRCVR